MGRHSTTDIIYGHWATSKYELINIYVLVRRKF